MALHKVVDAICRIQKWVRRVRFRIRAKLALKSLNRFVLKFNFDDCKVKFDGEIIKLEKKQDEKVQEKFEREERLRKLKPMNSKILMFKKNTFRIDTNKHEVLWCTEKQNLKNGTT